MGWQRGMWSTESGLLPLALGCLLPFVGAGRAAAQCTPHEVAKIVAEDGTGGELFGWSVSLDGKTLLVGSPFDSDLETWSGSAYIFERDHGGIDNWGHIAKIVPLDGEAQELFGYSVSISGDTVIVGAPADDDKGIASGSAYVFERNTGGLGRWGQVAKLLASDGSQSDGFGKSVSIGGGTVVVGASQSDLNAVPYGAAYVFARDWGGTGNWGQVIKLVGSDAAPGDQFGDSVAIEGETAIVGAPGHDYNGQESGAAFVFEREAGGTNGWGQTGKLLALDGGTWDQFGSVALSQDTAIVGAITDDQNGLYAGSAYVFERHHGGPNKWGQVAKALPTDGESPDQFGYFLSVSNDTAVIGSLRDTSNGTESGSAYVFYRDMGGANQWGQVSKIYPSDAAPFDQFGIPSISGDTIVVGSGKALSQGAAYVFERRLAFPATTYCTAKPTSIPGCVPAIKATGVASASATDGFTLHAERVPGASKGVFLYTHMGAVLPVHGRYGTICIDSRSLFRTGPLLSSGTAGECDGILTFDWNWFAHTVTQTDPASTEPGTLVDGQFWYRDPNNTGSANLTDAVSFIVCR